MKQFLFVILSLLFTCSYAQNLQVNFGELIPTDRTAFILDAGIAGGKLFVVEQQKKFILLKFYNPTTMKFITSKVVQQNNCKGIKDCISDDFGYVKTLFMKDNVIMLFETYEKSSKQSILFAQKITNEGNFDGKLVIIDKIAAESRRNSGSFLTWFSEDSTKFLIIQNPPYDKYQGEKFLFKVYNSKLENLSNFSAALPYKDKNVSVSDYYLANDGTVYMLVRVSKEKGEKEKGQDLSFYSIFAFKGDGSSSEFLVKIPDKDIETIALRLDNKNNKVICSGLYSDISKGFTGKKIDGIFYLRVNIEKKELEATGFKQIDNSVLAAILDVKEEKIDKKGKVAGASKNFEIRDIISKSDGTTTLITEYRDLIITTHTTTNSNGMTTTTTTYHYYRKNIFIINIAQDGTILSFIDIPKYQYSVNDGGKFLSFLLFQKDDRIIFIYNDNVENMSSSVKSIKDVKRMVNLSKANVVAVEINKDGTYTKKEIYNLATKKIAMIPERGIRIGNGNYIVPIQQAPGKITCSCAVMFSKLKSGIAKIVL
ncbi:MAG: hypothetical protein CVU05_02900 [Bacteroidetes bacterium HGW-Bacteroidetes-21]|jgi:hypothetical protein|nr:MAG: hypothetical protein CVU05_02900 [Bacteroidetes bacterium HGW-Bacteroidetes-21]